MMKVSKPTVEGLRRINRCTVGRQSYLNWSVSRQELSQCSGLSSATVTNVGVELIQEGIVVEAGLEESQGGRPRSILTVDPNYGCFIGVDVGETLTQIELFDLTLRKLGAAAYPLALNENHPKQVVQRILQGLEAVLVESSITQENVIGIGIGVPGLVEQSEHGSVYAPSWGWHNVPLVTLLQEHIQMPIYLDNGAKAMAQAESMFGAGRGVEHFAVFLLGVCISPGLIAHGSLYRVATNTAGEWGHTLIVLDGLLCRCGLHVCLEAC